MDRVNYQDLPLDKRREGLNTAEVVLAFPLDSEYVPVIKRQHVFAFLPPQDFGFPVSTLKVRICNISGR
jgi:hypothetical protein